MRHTTDKDWEKKTVEKHYEQLHVNKADNLDERGRFLWKILPRKYA